MAAAARVFGKRKHYLKNRPLIVSLLAEAAESSNLEDEEDDKLLEVDSQSEKKEQVEVKRVGVICCNGNRETFYTRRGS